MIDEMIEYLEAQGIDVPEKASLSRRWRMSINPVYHSYNDTFTDDDTVHFGFTVQNGLWFIELSDKYSNIKHLPLKS